MRLPDRWYRRLERFYLGQRQARQQEDQRRLGAQDAAFRAWANQARVAHNANRCIPRCPFRHDLPL